MTKRNDRTLIVAPDAPGDVVAARYAVAALALESDIVVFAEKPLHPLLVGLDVPLVESLAVDFLPTRVVDLCLSSRTRFEVARFSVPRLVRLGAFDDQEPGEIPLPIWDSTGGIHFSVLLARYSNRFRSATTFDQRVWGRSLFPLTSSPGTGSQVALCPGSNRAGTSKRWPAPIWSSIADRHRKSGFKVVWFLGPDEMELIEELCEPADVICDGEWASVIEMHQRCAFGVTHDTVHLHIRSFSLLPTLAIFRRDWVTAWASYPGNHVVALMEPDPSAREVSAVLQLCDRHRRTEFAGMWHRESRATGKLGRVQ